MRCSSGRVSPETSIMGGWYVWIMESGRVEVRESGREGGGFGEGEWSWWLSYAVLVTENEEGLGSLTAGFATTDGLAGAGEAGFAGDGEAEAIDVLRRWSLLPPHSDMKESTAEEAWIVRGCHLQAHGKEGFWLGWVTSFRTGHGGSGQLAADRLQQCREWACVRVCRWWSVRLQCAGIM